jgi:hypothetical protein
MRWIWRWRRNAPDEPCMSDLQRLMTPASNTFGSAATPRCSTRDIDVCALLTPANVERPRGGRAFRQAEETSNGMMPPVGAPQWKPPPAAMLPTATAPFIGFWRHRTGLGPGSLAYRPFVGKNDRFSSDKPLFCEANYI